MQAACRAVRRTTGAFRAYTSAAAPSGGGDGGGDGGGAAEGYALGPSDHSLASGALKAKIRNGDAVTGVLTNMWGDTNHVEMLGLMGAFDFLWVEAEHGTPSPSDCEKLYLAAERRALPTVTRIGYGEHLEPGLMQKYLVGGSGGIILPQCESALDVRRVVDGVKVLTSAFSFFYLLTTNSSTRFPLTSLLVTAWLTA